MSCSCPAPSIARAQSTRSSTSLGSFTASAETAAPADDEDHYFTVNRTTSPMTGSPFSGTIRAARLRHDNGVSGVFFDGHAKWIASGALPRVNTKL